jgi:hypothetical protein
MMRCPMSLVKVFKRIDVATRVLDSRIVDVTTAGSILSKPGSVVQIARNCFLTSPLGPLRCCVMAFGGLRGSGQAFTCETHAQQEGRAHRGAAAGEIIHSSLQQ